MPTTNELDNLMVKLQDGLYATNVAAKLKFYDKFVGLVKDQFQYGGKKYELLPSIESTDILVLIFGVDGLLWTVVKYILRFRNTHREKDLLKVACYMYILWLKYGFHLNAVSDTDTWNEDKQPQSTEVTEDKPEKEITDRESSEFEADYDYWPTDDGEEISDEGFARHLPGCTEKDYE